MKPDSENRKSKEAPKTMAETKVEEVLTDKPATLHPDDTVHTAGNRMREMHVAEWPVAKEEKLLGTVDNANTDYDVQRYGHDPEKTLVAQNMSTDVAYCYHDESCEEALAKMEAHNLQFLPVVDRDKRIAGIVSRDELIATRAASPHRELEK